MDDLEFLILLLPPLTSLGCRPVLLLVLEGLLVEPRALCLLCELSIKGATPLPLRLFTLDLNIHSFRYLYVGGRLGAGNDNIPKEARVCLRVYILAGQRTSEYK